MWPFAAYPESTPSKVNGKTYDYVIVGGGTAGCVLASRLSRDPSVSVLVLEKGHAKDSMMSRMPLPSQNIFGGDALQVQSTRWTEPIPGANGRKSRLWASEGIGGSSRINAMLWTRGSPGDYDGWAEMGLDNWAWEKVEPYFRNLEDAISQPTSPSRGHSGPMQVRQQHYPFQWTSYLEKAAQKVGLSVLKDGNDPAALSTGYVNLDVAINHRGERESGFRPFLSRDIALQRHDHLTVCTGVVASRLQLDVKTGTVGGVYFRSTDTQKQDADGPGQDMFVAASREVIICSGAICSPQLLLLSGIGPRESAKRLGIPLARELPVGSTFSDHWSTPVIVKVPQNESLHVLESIWGLWYLLLWIFTGTGLMGLSSCLQSIFVNTKVINETTLDVKSYEDHKDDFDGKNPRNIPNIEIMVIPSNSLQRPVPGYSLLSFYSTMIQPRGMGRLEVLNLDPFTHPRIVHPMFVNHEDRKNARLGVRFTMRIADELQNGGYPHPSPFVFAPGNNLGFLEEYRKEGGGPITLTHQANEDTKGKTWKDVTDEEIDDYMSRVSHSSLHFSSTCPMSNNDEKCGVVDQKLRVYGFKNLRVADCSVFPKVPSVHTMAPAMMVAERCADFIKEEWEQNSTKVY